MLWLRSICLHLLFLAFIPNFTQQFFRFIFGDQLTFLRFYLIVIWFLITFQVFFVNYASSTSTLKACRDREANHNLLRFFVLFADFILSFRLLFIEHLLDALNCNKSTDTFFFWFCLALSLSLFFYHFRNTRSKVTFLNSRLPNLSNNFLASHFHFDCFCSRSESSQRSKRNASKSTRIF
jgi:hypothetical protein